MTEVIIPLKVCVAGRFKMEAVRPDGSRRLLADWDDNLITDFGLEFLGGGTAGYFLEKLHVGTGNTPPSFGDTQLAIWKAANTSKVGDTVNGSPFGAQATAPYFGWKRGTYRFSAGTATGNIAEFGLSPVVTNTNMCARALVKDGSGNPTTVTVLADEMLDVTYELRMYPPLTDSSFIVSISGINYNFTVRALGVTDGGSWGNFAGTAAGMFYNGTGPLSTYFRLYKNASLAPITAGVITGTVTAVNPSPNVPNGNNTAGGVNQPYVANTKVRNFISTWDVNVATDVAGVSGMGILTTKGCFQVVISPPIPKDGTNNLSITSRVSWARYP